MTIEEAEIVGHVAERLEKKIIEAATIIAAALILAAQTGPASDKAVRQARNIAYDVSHA